MANNKRLVAYIVNDEELVAIIDDNMLSCEFGALDRGNITDVVNWGIYANRGSISFIDKIGFFNNQNVNSPALLNYIVKFYLADKISRTLVATFKIDSVKFDEETRQVNIELVSKLLGLSTEKATRSIYPFYETNLSEILNKANEVFEKTIVYEGDDTKNLSAIIGCPYIEKDTVWNVLTKICQAGMSRIFENEDGTPIITSGFPLRSPIVLNPNNIISIPNHDFVSVENCSIDITKREVVERKVLDGSTSNFSIKWSEGIPAEFLGTEGITIEETYQTFPQQSWNIITHIKSGNLYIKTPYKISAVYQDESYLTYNRTEYDASAQQAAPNSKSHDTAGVWFAENYNIVNETDISANLNEGLAINSYYIDPEVREITLQLTGGTIRFPISTFEDYGTDSLKTREDARQFENIPSNDLIQNISYYLTENEELNLGRYIISDVQKRYGKGIECFEIECLFNDYYDENGNKVFDREDLSTHFVKYDVIIPYVMKKGQRVPLRKNADGTPKKFRIIGISYSYDGLLKQKLYVQEERYDVD